MSMKKSRIPIRQERIFVVGLLLICVACGRFEPDTIARFQIGSSEGDVGLTQGGYEAERVCPGPIAAGNDGALYILDKANGRILTIGQAGEASSIPLPSGDTAQAIAVDATGLFVWFKDLAGNSGLARLDGSRLVAIDRAGAGGFGPNGDEALDSVFDDMGYVRENSDDTIGAGGFGPQDAEAPPFKDRWTRSIRTDDEIIKVEFTRSEDRQTILAMIGGTTLRSITTPSLILDVSILRIDPLTNLAAFLVTDDRGDASAYVYSGESERPRKFNVPLTSTICREQGITAVTPAGDVLFLRVSMDEARIQKLRESSILDPLIKPSVISDSKRLDGRDGFERVLEAQQGAIGAGGFGEFDAPTRRQVVVTAQSYLDFEFELTRKNYDPAAGNGIWTIGSCGDARNAWTRPPYIDAVARSQRSGWTSLSITRAPYAWGGFDSILDMQAKFSAGRLAGDVCTSNGVIFDPGSNPNITLSAGVDCSGLVSRAWGLSSKLGTSGLAEAAHSTPIGWDELEPGDIINKPGKHVRLFETWTGEARDVAQVIEAATRDCGGSVCRNTYSVGALAQSGYRPYRANHLAFDE